MCGTREDCSGLPKPCAISSVPDSAVLIFKLEAFFWRLAVAIGMSAVSFSQKSPMSSVYLIVSTVCKTTTGNVP